MTQPKQNLKIIGCSVGDMSVGIPSSDFELDTGLPLDKDTIDMLNSKMTEKKWSCYRHYLLHNFARLMYELHDNGSIEIDTNEHELTGEELWHYGYHYGYREHKDDMIQEVVEGRTE